MKKMEYLAPEMETYVLNTKATLLSGSYGDEGEQPGTGGEAGDKDPD